MIQPGLAVPFGIFFYHGQVCLEVEANALVENQMLCGRFKLFSNGPVEVLYNFSNVGKEHPDFYQLSKLASAPAQRMGSPFSTSQISPFQRLRWYHMFSFYCDSER